MIDATGGETESKRDAILYRPTAVTISSSTPPGTHMVKLRRGLLPSEWRHGQCSSPEFIVSGVGSKPRVDIRSASFLLRRPESAQYCMQSVSDGGVLGGAGEMKSVRRPPSHPAT
jgi:hypothetical protein